MVSLTSASRYITSASRYITSASRYHPRYQSSSSMFICGLIPPNFAELDEAVPIATNSHLYDQYNVIKHTCYDNDDQY